MQVAKLKITTNMIHIGRWRRKLKRQPQCSNAACRILCINTTIKKLCKLPNTAEHQNHPLATSSILIIPPGVSATNPNSNTSSNPSQPSPVSPCHPHILQIAPAHRWPWRMCTCCQTTLPTFQAHHAETRRRAPQGSAATRYSAQKPSGNSCRAATPSFITICVAAVLVCGCLPASGAFGRIYE